MTTNNYLVAVREKNRKEAIITKKELNNHGKRWRRFTRIVNGYKIIVW